MSKKIAILKEYNFYDDEYCRKLIESISDWTEVSDDEYNSLVRWQVKGDYTVITRLDSDEFIKKSVQDYLKWAEAEEKRKSVEAENRARKREEKERQKLAKAEEAEKKLFKELSKKYAS